MIPIPDFQGYTINIFGEITSFLRGKRILIPYKAKNGYYYVNLRQNNEPHYRAIHKLVMQVFGPKSKPGQIIIHKDGDKSNNSMANLRWTSKKPPDRATLVAEAIKVAEGHGHKLGRFKYHTGCAMAVCRDCNRGIVVVPKHTRQIGGPAYEEGCNK